MAASCAISSCRSTSSQFKRLGITDVRLHCLPINDPDSSDIRNEWIKRCKLEKKKMNSRTTRICSLHFKPDDFERDFQNELSELPIRKILKETAIPSLKLGSDDPVTIEYLENHARQPTKQLKYTCGEQIFPEESICRLCLHYSDKLSPIHKLHLVFDDYNTPYKVDAILGKYIQIKIGQNDLKPPNVCVSCAFLISQTHNFLQMCVANDNKISEALCSNTTREIEISSEPVPTANILIDDKYVTLSKNQSDIPIQELQNKGTRAKRKRKHKESFRSESDDIEESINSDSDEETNSQKAQNDEVTSISQIKSEIEVKCHQLEVLKSLLLKENVLDEVDNIKSIVMENGRLFVHTTPSSNEKSFERKGVIKFETQQLASILKCPKLSKGEAEDIVYVIVMIEDIARPKEPEAKPPLPSIKSNCKKCVLCKEPLTNLNGNKSARVIHLRRHEASNLCCKGCNSSFPTVRELQEHIKDHHKGNNMCQICGADCQYRTRKLLHMRSHYKEKRYSCDCCNLIFNTRNLLSMHWSRKHKGILFDCVKCNSKLESFDELVAHSRRIHKTDHPKRLSLAVRDRVDGKKISNNTEECLEHDNIDGHPKLSVGPKCDKVSNEPSLLEEAMLSHMRYQCTICKKGFYWERTLRRHMIDLHKQMDCCYVCETCGKILVSKQAYTRHQRIHKNHQPPSMVKNGSNEEYKNDCTEENKGSVENTNMETLPSGPRMTHCVDEAFYNMEQSDEEFENANVLNTDEIDLGLRLDINSVDDGDNPSIEYETVDDNKDEKTKPLPIKIGEEVELEEVTIGLINASGDEEEDDVYEDANGVRYLKMNGIFYQYVGEVEENTCN